MKYLLFISFLLLTFGFQSIVDKPKTVKVTFEATAADVFVKIARARVAYSKDDPNSGFETERVTGGSYTIKISAQNDGPDQIRFALAQGGGGIARVTLNLEVVNGNDFEVRLKNNDANVNPSVNVIINGKSNVVSGDNGIGLVHIN